ncbi:DNA polymerase III subunit psi [Wenzhouxiangella sp. AB-CW3]|uniref:DNA polymerase III subunit psi n=1 Tax=Wenzhouxiangella sp. AB-CW3 TaxID=2771012 RepID=UPI00168BFFB4|nr:DNA polymerase III subunit psi [Wenzhouxiangella sp. AB-CW3]QOC23014.1 DNA polymerase III subunit psi [Wenzhouxiangella sp. AB-CW3]
MRASSPHSRQRLAAMGIDLWIRRDRPLPASQVATTTDGQRADLRIRMSSGSGPWLLVQSEPWSGAHEKLLADITATIGPEQVRFGQWAVSDSAGVPIHALDDRGIRHVLAFGDSPRPVDSEQIIVAPALAELAESASARRRLWQVLAPGLAR